MRMPKPTSGRGFSLIEMLVVILIILILASIVMITTSKMRQKAKENKTKAVLQAVRGALTQYLEDGSNAYRSYPVVGYDSWPSPYDPAGVDFDLRWVPKEEDNFKPEFKDPADKNYLLDAYGKRIKYRRTGSKYLAWSYGPNGIDEIGPDPKKQERGVGDDISSFDVDY